MTARQLLCLVKKGAVSASAAVRPGLDGRSQLRNLQKERKLSSAAKPAKREKTLISCETCKKRENSHQLRNLQKERKLSAAAKPAKREKTLISAGCWDDVISMCF
jgi:hypothetical protein